MFNKVLIAVDCKDVQNLLMNRVCDLKKCFKIKQIVLVYVKPIGSCLSSLNYEQCIESNDIFGSELQNYGFDEIPSVKLEGFPSREICDKAKEEKFSLIFINSYGKNNNQYGTTMSNILRLSNTPVFVEYTNNTGIQIGNKSGRKKILVATDFSDNSMVAVKMALNISEENEVTVIHIKEGYLFSLNWNDYKDYLKEGPIEENLRQAFEDHGHHVSDSAELSKQGETWMVMIDGEKKYGIEDTSEELNIYKEGIFTDTMTKNKRCLKDHKNIKEIKEITKTEDSVSTHIGRYASKYEMDFIIVGKTGRTKQGFDGLLIGSTAEEIIRTA